VAEDRVRQVGAGEIGVPEVRRREVDADEPASLEARVHEFRTVEVRAGEVDAGELRPAHLLVAEDLGLRDLLRQGVSFPTRWVSEAERCARSSSFVALSRREARSASSEKSFSARESAKRWPRSPRARSTQTRNGRCPCGSPKSTGSASVAIRRRFFV